MNHRKPTHGIPVHYLPNEEDKERRGKTYALEEIFWALENVYISGGMNSSYLVDHIHTWYSFYTVLGARLPILFILDQRWDDRGRYRGTKVHKKPEYDSLSLR